MTGDENVWRHDIAFYGIASRPFLLDWWNGMHGEFFTANMDKDKRDLGLSPVFLVAICVGTALDAARRGFSSRQRGGLLLSARCRLDLRQPPQGELPYAPSDTDYRMMRPAMILRYILLRAGKGNILARRE